ncbi:MAG: EscU/YscU/HrcU family type III secretion system export apparatus switch protein [Oscillospiraceae bacterium]|jgi:FlhB-like protein|nr:EscU/YscU/HrcU family type III secretion system export apparatus switch protein [Oscillospiraceae bacterium]
MSKFNDKAVALKYREERDRAPVIVAAGKGSIAQKIIEIADLKGVPIYKDSATATILSQLKVGQQIPVDLYSVVASIYVAIIEMAEEMSAGKRVPQQVHAEVEAHDVLNDVGIEAYTPVKSIEGDETE